MDVAIEGESGISDANIGSYTYTSTYTASIDTDGSPGGTWQYVIDLRSKSAGLPSDKNGTLTNGPRTLHIARRSEEDSFVEYTEAYEDGELLARKSSDREYDFRADLSAELKVLLLAAIEIFGVDKRGQLDPS